MGQLTKQRAGSQLAPGILGHWATSVDITRVPRNPLVINTWSKEAEIHKISNACSCSAEDGDFPTTEIENNLHSLSEEPSYGDNRPRI